MGTYGFVRIAMPMLLGAWRGYAVVLDVVGAVSLLYGALVASAQTSFKRAGSAADAATASSRTHLIMQASRLMAMVAAVEV